MIELGIDVRVKTVYELDSIGSGQGAVAGSYKHGKESSSFMKGREFLKQVSDYQLQKEHFPH